MAKKKSRIERLKKIQQKTRNAPPSGQMITRQDMDRMLFDMVMGEIYENSDLNSILFEDILHKYQVQLPNKEKERVWDVLTNSMWVSPMMGFGQVGKLELTPQGFQLMSQYGSYSNYLSSLQMHLPNTQPTNNTTQNAPQQTGDTEASQNPEEKKKQ